MITADVPQHFLDTLRPSIESIRLAEFVHLSPHERILEIGCGNGYIALYLACRFPQSQEIMGIDLQPMQITVAEDAAKQLQNHPIPMAPVRFYAGDARSAGLSNTGFDAIVCNPPFFVKGNCRPSPNPNRRLARLDDTLSLFDLLSCSARLLKPGGRLYLVFPNERMEEILAVHAKLGFVLESNSLLSTIRKRSGGINLIYLCYAGHP